jgi:hypothetical protein
MTQEEQLHAYGKEVVDALSPMVKWQYDEFHKTLLAEFSVDKEVQVMSALQQCLPMIWDSKTIKKAPDEIKHLSSSFHKLIKKQKLLSASLEKNPKFMLAWWPWGHGATISIRLFLVNSSPFVEKQGVLHRIKKIFS